jgi:hypothetical protein
VLVLVLVLVLDGGGVGWRSRWTGLRSLSLKSSGSDQRWLEIENEIEEEDEHD